MTRKAKIYFHNQLTGILVEGDNGYSFYYEKAYLGSPNPQGVSLTLPISDITYHSKVLFPFFDGLIPEGWLLEFGKNHWKLNPRDRFELLINLCRDTIGAVSVHLIKEDHE